MRGRIRIVLPALFVAQIACGPILQRSTLPPSLSDEAFWTLSAELSEPSGQFTHSDNLVSNEIFYVHVLRLLRPTGGAYIGVGPEQNFSYIARLRPDIAFIVDIRRENLSLHLMYKALFELSADRADFVSRLFSRERPDGLGRGSSVDDLFDRYDQVKPSEQLLTANARLIRERLLGAHRFPLTPQDLDWIDHVLRAFSSDGPYIRYALHTIGEPSPSYRALMTAQDVSGRSYSYLATENGFRFVKDLSAANRIIPVVGDFGGSHALQRVGDYVREHRSQVRAFYGSNVEVYLNREKMAAYCQNLAWLPHGWRTWYIGSKGMQSFLSKVTACTRGRE
jgi:hypothetical protein